jgi:hypothetical protein
MRSTADDCAQSSREGKRSAPYLPIRACVGTPGPGNLSGVSQRNVRQLVASQLEALSTGRLLEYRSRLLELEDSASTSDLNEAELLSLDPALIHFKDESQWIDTYSMVKSILAHREHVD